MDKKCFSNILGHHFQAFQAQYNYIANNNVEYRNVMGAFGIQLNFTTNVIYKNVGQCILNASVLEQVTI